MVGALGGILVALLVKHADTIVKGFATSVSIILTGVASYFLFNTDITIMFMLGTVVVITSLFDYTDPDPVPSPSIPTSAQSTDANVAVEMQKPSVVNHARAT